MCVVGGLVLYCFIFVAFAGFNVLIWFDLGLVAVCTWV